MKNQVNLTQLNPKRPKAEIFKVNPLRTWPAKKKKISTNAGPRRVWTKLCYSTQCKILDWKRFCTCITKNKNVIVRNSCDCLCRSGFNSHVIIIFFLHKIQSHIRRILKLITACTGRTNIANCRDLRRKSRFSDTSTNIPRNHYVGTQIVPIFHDANFYVKNILLKAGGREKENKSLKHSRQAATFIYDCKYFNTIKISCKQPI